MTEICDHDKSSLIIYDLSISLVVLTDCIIQGRGFNYTNKTRNPILRTIY